MRKSRTGKKRFFYFFVWVNFLTIFLDSFQKIVKKNREKNRSVDRGVVDIKNYGPYVIIHALKFMAIIYGP